MHLFGITGRMRAGKDTLADYLQSKYGGKTIKFATPLYEMQEAIYKIARLPYPAGLKDRALLQDLGTRWGRNTIDKNIWLNVMSATLDEQDNTEDIYCTDCRFGNEFDLFKSRKAILIRVTRPLEERLKYGATNLDHESESALDGHLDSSFDFVVDNNSSLDSFYQKIDAFYQSL